MNVLVNRVLKGFLKNFPNDEETTSTRLKENFLMIQRSFRSLKEPWGRWCRKQETMLFLLKNNFLFF